MGPLSKLAGAAVLTVLATSASAQTIAVVGGRADDPFFAKVKRGIDDAAMVVEAHGGKVTYLPLQTYDNIGADAANLIRTAVGQGADAIAPPNWVPSAEDAAFQAATAAGKTILLYNAGGTEKARELGALNYVGTEAYTTGLAAGEYFGTRGAKNVTCVDTVPGAREPVRALAECFRDARGIDMFSSVILDFGQGHHAIFAVSLAQASAQSLQVVGERACMDLPRPTCRRGPSRT
jgi:simple sugar transport system substrate-binding protein